MTEDTLLHCIENLKIITAEQGKQIATLTANTNNVVKKVDELHGDIKEIFIKLDGQNVRISRGEDWQDNFGKKQADRLAVLGIVIAVINVFTVIVAFVLGRST